MQSRLVGWVGSIQRNWASVSGCEQFDDSRCAPSFRSPWPPLVTWPPTCGGRGTPRRRTSSGLSMPTRGSPPRTTRSSCWALSPRRVWPSWPRTSASCGCSSSLRPTSTTTSPATAGSSARPVPRRRRRSATSPRSSASPACCRSTPAGSASWPATTSRPPATSASRSWGSGCSTRWATSGSRSPGRGGSRRPTPCSTPTGCRSPSSARPTARRPRSPSTLPGDAPLVARIFVAHVGRVPLLLLDSDVEENPEPLREVTDRLYGGSEEHRLRQELLLGVGGVRALRAHSRITGAPDPEVFHTNEGHAGFLGLERIRELSAADDGPHLDFDTALEVSRAGTVFTTHTPVPAGIDRFPRDLMEQYFGAEQPAARSAARPDPGAGCRGLRGRRRRRLQHGRDGLPALPARQRRLAPPRRGQPRDVQRPLAGVRRGRGADHLDHQRRARARPGWPARCSSSPRQAAPTATPTTPRRLGRRRQDPRRRALGDQARAAREARRRRPHPAAASRGSSAVPPRPSSAGSTRCSTPTC